MPHNETMGGLGDSGGLSFNIQISTKTISPNARRPPLQPPSNAAPIVMQIVARPNNTFIKGSE